MQIKNKDSRKVYIPVLLLMAFSLTTTLINLYLYISINKAEKQLIVLERAVRQNFQIYDSSTHDHLQSKSNQKAQLSREGNNSVLLSHKEEVGDLVKIVNDAGLKNLAELNAASPNILKELMKDELGKKRRTYLEEARLEKRKKENQKYNNDTALKVLFTSYLSQESSDEKKEEILNEMISRYPDAHIVGEYIYSFAVKMAQKGDVKKVEEAYDMLKNFETRNSKKVETYSYEAKPNLELQLAYMYYQSGDTEKLKKMLDTVETNCSKDTQVMSPFPGNNQSLPVIVSRFRKLADIE